MKLNYEKYSDGLIPAIVQDASTSTVLMLGFMNCDAVMATVESGKVVFFSRSRQTLWTKGETSGNFLELVSITPDCDNDTLLIKANPSGPVCHTGTATCFGESEADTPAPTDFLLELESIIDDRRRPADSGSYISQLFTKGINKIAQKVGEEAVELVIEAKDDNAEMFRSEAADLLFHTLVLFRAKNTSILDVINVLRERRR